MRPTLGGNWPLLAEIGHFWQKLAAFVRGHTAILRPIIATLTFFLILTHVECQWLKVATAVTTGIGLTLLRKWRAGK